MTGPTEEILRQLESLADPADAEQLSRFFRTGPGEYGEGDRFLGVRAPALDRIARTHQSIDLPDIEVLLGSPFHEQRMVALRILVRQYRRADGDGVRKRLARFYLDHPEGVDNWDLVDISAPWLIGGEILRGRLLATTRRMARAEGLWIRRQAVVATLGPVREGQIGFAVEICAEMVVYREDLIQKAVGWVLREVGKRDRATLTGFLDLYGSGMGRTALRYSIERLPEAERRHYLVSTR